MRGYQIERVGGSIVLSLNGYRYSIGKLDQYKETLNFRWEALRRRKAYLDDCETFFAKRCGRKKYPKFGDEWINKHGIYPPINPNLTFVELWTKCNKKLTIENSGELANLYISLMNLLVNPVGSKGNFLASDSIGVWSSSLLNSGVTLDDFESGQMTRNTFSISEIPSKYLKERRVLLVLNIGAKKKIITKQVSQVVKVWQSKLGIDGKKHNRTAQANAGLKYYLGLFKIYDAYQQYPGDWETIAKKGLNFHDREKARKSYKRAVQLIEKAGFRKIVL